MLVGEAPGAQEDALGKPFVGGAGEILNHMLARVGIVRGECFLTNLAHVRPPKNEFGWLITPLDGYPLHPELIRGLQLLRDDITEIQPNLIIALGAWPLYFLTQKQGIDKWRGSILPNTLVPSIKTIATYHPAYILRVYDYKAVAEFDLLRCAQEATTPEITYPTRNFILNPSREDTPHLVQSLLQATWLAVDIECVLLDNGGWRLSCVGFADSADRAITWPCDEPWQRDAVKTLCESYVPKVLQNGTFDLTVLAEEGITLNNFAWDTMIAHHALYPECAGGEDEMSFMTGKKKQAALKKGLAFQTSIYTREPFYKDDSKIAGEVGDYELFLRYNARDAVVTREIRDVQERELREFGTMEVFHRGMSAVEPLYQAGKHGILIDQEVMAILRQQHEQEVEILQKALEEEIDQPLNVKSTKQVQELIYGKLNLAPRYSKKTGNPTADKDTITALAGRYQHPVLLTILEIRKKRDMIERYLTVQIDDDGMMRCSWDITGTRSGRLSSRQTIKGTGTNLQNIPEGVRRMFIAQPGQVFVYRDYSQAEARIVAYLAQCEKLIRLFEDPTRDVHVENARRIFSRIDISKEQRYLAKRVVHASNYGLGPDHLAEVINEDTKTTGVSIETNDARKLIEAYFYLYPEIKEIFWKGIEREICHSRTLNTPFGRKRQFFGRWDDKLLREAYSYIPQSTVGDLGVMASVACHHIDIPNSHFLLNVHDSVMMQCREEDVEQMVGAMAQAMAIPITINERTFYIPTDCKVGYNWSNRTDANPRGLIDFTEWGVQRGRRQSTG